MKKWISEFDVETESFFVLEEEVGIGFYLYIWIEGYCVEDHLQVTFKLALRQAEEEFGVSRESWKAVEPS